MLEITKCKAPVKKNKPKITKATGDDNAGLRACAGIMIVRVLLKAHTSSNFRNDTGGTTVNADRMYISTLF